MHLLRRLLGYGLVATLFTINFAQASVTMLGNRIIYPANSASVDVKLMNDDDSPYIIQSWFDSGDEESNPQTGKAPFVATPPIFKIDSHSGQAIRVVFSNDPKSLPQDRESVFYFNFLQIPPTSAQTEEDARNTNKLVILLKNRVKLFFRPKGLPTPANHVGKIGISIHKNSKVSGYSVQLDNNNPWYASVVGVTVEQNNQQSVSTDPIMISPFDKQDWRFTNLKLKEDQPLHITINMMTDQGGVISHTYPVSF